MSLPQDAVRALKNMILVQERVTGLTEDVKALYTTCDDIKERLARIEGKFELLEHMGQAKKRLRE